MLVFAGAAIFIATAVTRVLRSVYNYQLLSAASQCPRDTSQPIVMPGLQDDTKPAVVVSARKPQEAEAQADQK